MKYTIHNADALSWLREYDGEPFDACLCDPPYGLTATEPDMREVLRHWLDDEDYQSGKGGFMNKSWDGFVPGPPLWAALLATLRPGANAMIFGGARTFDLLTVAARLGGFVKRDMLAYMYGSGYPGGLDIAKKLDKLAGAERKVVGVEKRKGKSGGIMGKQTVIERQITEPASEDGKLWHGYNTRIKPAYEPILWAMKAIDGSFAENALTHGVSGLNIYDNLIGDREMLTKGRSDELHAKFHAIGGGWTGDIQYEKRKGTWPTNVMLDSHAAGWLRTQHADAPNFFYTSKSSPKERDIGLFDLDDKKVRNRFVSGNGQGDWDTVKNVPLRQAKNNHPTLKPIDLCRHLASLMLPPDTGRPRRIIVPFSGSGSEIAGCLLAGWDEVVGIEIDATEGYIEIAKRRIDCVIETARTIGSTDMKDIINYVYARQKAETFHELPIFKETE